MWNEITDTFKNIYVSHDIYLLNGFNFLFSIFFIGFISHKILNNVEGTKRSFRTLAIVMSNLYTIDIFIFSEMKFQFAKSYGCFSVVYFALNLSILKFVLLLIVFFYFFSLSEYKNKKIWSKKDLFLITGFLILTLVLILETGNFLNLVLLTELVCILVSTIGYFFNKKFLVNHLTFLFTTNCFLKIVLKFWIASEWYGGILT